VGLDAFQRFLFLTLREVQIPAQLQVHPETWSIAKKLCQAQGRAGCHTPPAINQIIDPLIRDMNGVRQFALGERHGDEELFEKHFAGVGRSTVRWNADHLDLPIQLVVIDNLNLTWTSVCPNKTNTVLIIDPNAVLASSPSGEFFQVIARRDAQLGQSLN
jgi:hypothetical protein